MVSMTFDDLQRLLWEFARHRVVTVAARTGLLSRLAQRPATPGEAASELGLDPDRWLIAGRKPG